MSGLDYLILFIYAIGTLAIGSLLSKRNKNSADMFAVSRQSPWWLSGISAFMSAFSAGTFVVWGGIAYKYGLVSVSILMSLGISSFLAGKFLAGRWADLGVTTVGEYIYIRFGKGLVQFYTWVGMIFKIIAMSVALYAFSTLFCAMVPLSEANPLRDPATGNLSITYACILSGLIMLFYAVSGGLWAVLIIDTVQFVVLMVTVLFVVPLIFEQVGGVQGFISAAPEGFLNLTNGDFTSWFLIGWVVIHTFKFGGEWVFIQRFLAVKDAREAKKSSYLLGALYLISPIVWMLPAMVYRVADPTANPEQAYFLACAAVLPHGMTGLLIAAMFSATASYIDGEINVYAGAITNDCYKPLIRPQATDKELVLAGRISSFLVGVVIIGGAVAIPYVGGAENVILTITSLLVVPMALPVIWGLFSAKISQKEVWYTTSASFLTAFLVKTLVTNETDHQILRWMAENTVVTEVGIGVFVPLLLLCLFEITGRSTAEGFFKMQKGIKTTDNIKRPAAIAVYPARLLAYSIGVLALMMYALAFTAGSQTNLVLTFGSALLVIGLIILIKTKD